MSSSDDLAAYFDQWYADMAETPRKDEIEQRHLGLPPHLLSTSLLTWDGIAGALGTEEVLVWGYETFGAKLCLTCSWQKQSSVLVHMVSELGLDSKYGYKMQPLSAVAA